MYLAPTVAVAAPTAAVALARIPHRLFTTGQLCSSQSTGPWSCPIRFELIAVVRNLPRRRVTLPGSSTLGAHLSLLGKVAQHLRCPGIGGVEGLDRQLGDGDFERSAEHSRHTDQGELAAPHQAPQGDHKLVRHF